VTAVRECVDVVVEAPDGAAALELKRRLERLGSPEVEFAEAWSVKLADADVHEVENEVRVWLRQIGLDSTIVETNTDEHHVFVPRHTHVPTHRDFIG
jgi:hypothetical protein